MVERIIEFDAADDPLLGPGWSDFCAEVIQALRDGGVLEPSDAFPGDSLPANPQARFTVLHARLSLLLQQKCGHRVEWSDVRPRSEPGRYTSLVEHEHCDVGMNADKLAWEILAAGRRQIAGPFAALRPFAADRVLPLDTAAIYRAAERRGIPTWKMDRYPYGRDPKDHEAQANAIRRHGLLALGHGAQGVRIEGTFCRTRMPLAAKLLDDPGALDRLCGQLGIPRQGGRLAAIAQHRAVLLVCGQVTALSEEGELHPSFEEAAARIFGELDAAVLAVGFQSTDFAAEIGEAGFVSAVDPAPDLSRWFEDKPDDLRRVAGMLVDGLFPGKGPYRIPIVAVTGSNGKTTTSRMIARILQHAGHAVGMACTDGVFVGGDKEVVGDLGGLSGHSRLLFDPRVSAAVLETHHNSLFQEGLAYDWSDVAVCTGVTEEHIKAGAIESLEQMVRVKGFLLENARHAAVLNADNPACVGMLPRLRATRTGFVSTSQTVEDLQSLGGRNPFYVLVEGSDAGARVVLTEPDEIISVMPVAEIPATFGGAARFNVINALSAIAAAHALGISIDEIREAMKAMHMGPDTTPGRLNFHDNGQFRVLVDFAHNADGLAELSRFVDQLEVEGRKILLFAISGDRSDEAIRAAARAVAGHFDVYLCRRYPDPRGREVHEVAEMLAATLAEAGVEGDRIRTFHDHMEGMNSALAMGRQGDLIVMTHGGSEFETMWSAVTAGR